MSGHLGLKAVLVTLILLALAGGAILFRTTLLPVRPHPRRQTAVPVAATAPAASLATALASARARPLFRERRRPASVAFDPEATGAGGPAETASPPKPALALSGIVRGGGAEPAAVLEGVPGAEGSTVLRRGERVAGLRVVRIGPQRVVIAGFDTTWTLTVREPWR